MVSRVSGPRTGAEHTCDKIEDSDMFVLVACDEERHGGMRGYAIDLRGGRAVWQNVSLGLDDMKAAATYRSSCRYSIWQPPSRSRSRKS